MKFFIFPFLRSDNSLPISLLWIPRISRNVFAARIQLRWVQVARKLAMVEADLERAEERAEAGEA